MTESTILLPIISFYQEPFTYTIKFLHDDGIINIDVIHSEDYFNWSKTISEEINPMKTDLTKSNLFMKISPQFLFTLFTEFKNNTLDPIYTFRFPTTYKSWDTELFIELHTKIPYDDVSDIKFIILNPGKITDADRFGLKLTHLKNNQDTLNKSLQKEISDLKGQLVQMQSEIVQLKTMPKNINQHEIAHDTQNQSTKTIDEPKLIADTTTKEPEIKLAVTIAEKEFDLFA